MSGYRRLKEFFRSRAAGGIALAFSGGVDSLLLLEVLRLLRQEEPFPLAAMTIHSPFHREEETAAAGEAAERADVEWVRIDCDLLADPAVRENPPDRCYRCKRRIFSSVLAEAAARGLRTVVDGTNADDLGVWRPGVRALRELGVLSPLTELGISKAEVRTIAAELGMKEADKPASPCLATRFPYGTTLTPEALRLVAEGEALLRQVVPEARDLRLRSSGELARIEVPLAQLTNLPTIFSILREQPGKFIVFVDDLAFNDSCPEYTALKTVLEGGLEARPSNVVVYATSNRRNIVRQRFSERQDDVNERDTLEEKFSLADRFDLRLTFSAPTQEEYFTICRALLDARGAEYDWDELMPRARAWTVSHNGCSPRIARQFVDYIAGEGKA